MFESVTNSEIEDAIEQYDDPDHEDAYSTDEIRDLLDQINNNILNHWSLYKDAIDENAHELIYENDSVMILADNTGHFWNEQFKSMDIPDDEYSIRYSIIVSLHHKAARRHCNYTREGANPVVIEKPNAFNSGEQQVLREIARRTQEFGSVARAVDTLAIETHGWSQSQWASLTGRNRSTVTRTTDN
jgi:hypothetical protein